ncbi:class I SAM-dependent methyltransferase [Patescibacteria group bacterium]|nr:class I SAM-dependent methyltransferase [Patescibacteria group bacterium]
MNKVNLQGGDNNIDKSLYEIVFPFIKKNDFVLNLGCGTRFNFEKALKKKKEVNITSCDIIPCVFDSNIIDKFIVQSVEEEFLLDKKFDVVTFFELIEHIDKTDELLKNCFNNLKQGGYLIFSFPNLTSIYSRIELFLGYQPHILEVSNEYANFGTGIFGKYNNPENKTIHHIRGISNKAMKEMVLYYSFEIEKIIGFEYRFGKLFKYIPSLAPVNIFICKKK